MGQCEGPVATVLAYVLWGQYQHEEHKLQLQAHSAGLASPGPRGKWGVTARSATLRQPSWDQHGRPPSPCEDGPVLCLMRCGHVWLWCTELNHEQSWLRWIRKADHIRGWVLTLHWSSARRYHRGKLREGGMGAPSVLFPTMVLDSTVVQDLNLSLRKSVINPKEILNSPSPRLICHQVMTGDTGHCLVSSQPGP